MKRWWIPGILLLSLAGCWSPSDTNSDSAGAGLGNGSAAATKVKLLLNWYPEAEHGGFYAALVHGYYAEERLNVEIIPGARGIVVGPELALGRVEFGVGNADDVLMARAQELDLVAVMAPMQNGPRCIMVREDSGIQDFSQLKNVTLQIDPARPYVPFLKWKGLLDDSVKLVPYNGTVSQLIAGPGFAQQAYVFSEPLLAQQEGVRVRNLMLSDVGYNPYASLLVTTGKYLSNNEAMVAKMVKASIRGWQRYLQDPKSTNVYIIKQNSEGMTAEALDYGAEKMRPLCLTTENQPFGSMTSERWAELYQQLTELKLLEGRPFDPKSAFTSRFVTTP